MTKTGPWLRTVLPGLFAPGLLLLLVAASLPGLLPRPAPGGLGTAPRALLCGAGIAALGIMVSRTLPRQLLEQALRGAGWMLAILCLVPAEPEHTFHFRGFERYTGVFGDPNYCGLYCGAALLFVMLELAEGVQAARSTRKLLDIAVPLLTAVALMFALLATYSRGAWLATVVAGTVTFGLQRARGGVLAVWRQATAAWPGRLGLVLGVGILSYVVWRWGLWQRLASPLNFNDFSWRNRVTAWLGLSRMISDQPLSGTGWESTSYLYQALYAPDHLLDVSAFERNSYLFAGAAAGLLLPWFLITWIVWTAWRGCEAPASNRGRRFALATMIVFAIGFWFEGGLFDLRVAATFWCALALASTHPSDLPPAPSSARSSWQSGAGIWLIVATGLIAWVAVARTTDGTVREWIADRPAIAMHGRGMAGPNLLLVRGTAAGRAAQTVNAGDIRAGLRAGYTVIADLGPPDSLREAMAAIQAAAQTGTGTVVAVCNLRDGIGHDELVQLLAEAAHAGISDLVCFAAGTDDEFDLRSLQTAAGKYSVNLAVFRAQPAANAQNRSLPDPALSWREPGLLFVDIIGEGDDCGAARPVLLRGALEYFARAPRP